MRRFHSRTNHHGLDRLTNNHNRPSYLWITSIALVFLYVATQIVLVQKLADPPAAIRSNPNLSPQPPTTHTSLTGGRSASSFA